MLIARLAVVVLAALAVAPAALGGVYTVTSTVDAVDAAPGDGVCLTAAGACTLRAAVQEANAGGGASRIDLPAGTYTLSLAGQNEDAAATGDLDVRSTIVVRGAGAADTVVAGGFVDRVFDVPLASAALTLLNLDVRDGQVTDGADVSVAGQLQLDQAIVENGNAARFGGGIRVRAGGTAIVTRSILRGNRAFQGAAVENEGALTISASTLSGNSGSGGGVFNTATLGVYDSTIATSGCGSCTGGAVDNSGTATLVGVTVAGDFSSPLSGALRNTGTLSVRDSIVDHGFGPECAGTITSLGHNLDRGTSCGFELQSTDPLLGALQDNGGFAPTMAPDPASPAVDAGDTSCSDTDERGLPRVGACDLGAVELQTVTATVTSVTHGRVASSPAGIDCPGACSARFAPGTRLAFSATPDDGYRFDGWNGSCGAAVGTGCGLTVSAPVTLTPVFSSQPAGPTLTVRIVGNGSASDSLTGAIACPARCTATYARGETVALSLVAAPGATLIDADGCSLEWTVCTVVLRFSTVVTVRFSGAAPAPVPVTVTKTGGGAVTGPGGIECGATCSASFAPGTTVALVAVPADGYRFAGWGGACSGSLGCSVTLAAATTVSAAFEAVTSTPPAPPASTPAPAPTPPTAPPTAGVEATPVFIVAVERSGNGSVSSSPAGISCPGTCSAAFGATGPVTLTATPDPGWHFAGWTGGCSGAAGCVFTGEARATAHFESDPPVARLTMSANGLAARFDGATSTATGGVASYEWAFGDGATATGARPAHRYARPGTYAVALTVADARGASATVTVRLKVVRLAAVTAAVTETVSVADGATISGPVSASVTETVTVNDGASPTKGRSVAVTETIVAADGATAAGPARVTVSGQIRASATPHVLPPAAISIHGTVTPVATPTVTKPLTPTTRRRTR